MKYEYLLCFPPSLLLIIAHAWLICCNVQQFQMLKLLTWIYFIAATMSLLLILWKEDLDKISFFSNEGCSDTRSGLTWKLQTIAEEYLGLISKSENTVFLALESQRRTMNTKELLFSPPRSISPCFPLLFCPDLANM